MDLKLIYGLKDDKLVHISEVESGLKCNCVCPSCKTELIARKGSKIKHHFAHNNTEDCKKGYETSIHILAKEILSEQNSIEGPIITIGPNDIVVHSMPIKYDRVEIEKKIENIIADIVVYKGERLLIIEIFVTHKIDKEKEEKLKKIGISTMEIDLSMMDKEINKEELREILLKDKEKKRWILNKPLDLFLKREEEILFSLISKHKIHHREKFWQSHYIEDCPKEKRKNWRIPIADLHNGGGCSECCFFQGYEYKEIVITTIEKADYPYKDDYGWYDDDGDYYEEDNDIDNKGYYTVCDYIPNFIYCGYKNQITDYESLKSFKTKK